MENKLDILLKNTGDMALKRRAEYIVGSLMLKKNDKVLDVGCGDGYYMHLLANLGIKLSITGFDNDPVALKKARQYLGKNAHMVEGNIMQRLPFPDNTFDKAVMSEVLEHLEDDTRGLKEVGRVLKKNGCLVITVPNANYPFLWDPVNWIPDHLFGYHIKSGFWAGIWNQHLRLYKPEQIKKVVKESGFKIITIKSLTFWCLPFNHYIVNLVARLIAHGNISQDCKSSLSKFEKESKRKWYLNFAFFFVNLLDRLNDYWQPKNTGVSVFIKAVKL